MDLQLGSACFTCGKRGVTPDWLAAVHQQAANKSQFRNLSPTVQHGSAQASSKLNPTLSCMALWQFGPTNANRKPEQFGAGFLCLRSTLH